MSTYRYLPALTTIDHGLIEVTPENNGVPAFDGISAFQGPPGPSSETLPLIQDSTVAQDEKSNKILENRKRHLVSSNKTLMNFIRAEVAAGCLSLPNSFKAAGLWTSLGLSPFIGIINIYFGLVLVYSSQYLCKKVKAPFLDFGHCAKKSFDCSSQILKPHSKKALYFVNTFVCLYQIGVAGVQYVFIVINVYNFMSYCGMTWHPSIRVMFCVFFPCFALIGQINHIAVLSWLATIGNVVFILAFVVVMQFIVRPPNMINDLPGFTDIAGLATYIGTMLYSYEGQAMILPLENRMKRPKDMGGLNGVLATGTVIIGVIFTAIGFFGYAKFGPFVSGTVTLNMPQTPLYQSCNLILAVAVFMGWPLQLFVMFEMFWRPIERKFLHRCTRGHWIAEKSFRLWLVFVVFCLGLAVPEIGQLVPIVGVTAGSFIAFIIPPILQLVTFWDEWSPIRRKVQLTVNLLTITLGFTIFFVGGYYNIMAVVVAG